MLTRFPQLADIEPGNRNKLMRGFSVMIVEELPLIVPLFDKSSSLNLIRAPIFGRVPDESEDCTFNETRFVSKLISSGSPPSKTVVRVMWRLVKAVNFPISVGIVPFSSKMSVSYAIGNLVANKATNRLSNSTRTWNRPNCRGSLFRRVKSLERLTCERLSKTNKGRKRTIKLNSLKLEESQFR